VRSDAFNAVPAVCPCVYAVEVAVVVVEEEDGEEPGSSRFNMTKTSARY
jgi:hypothetical protein